MKHNFKSKNCIYEGKVFHHRMKPKKHKFNYSVFYTYINLKILKRKSIYKLLSFNKFNLFSIYENDHGINSCENLEIWIRDLLISNGIKNKIKDIYLLSYPRILGYVFNPLSIYTCLDHSDKIIAQIYEVHNTFKQRYFYIVKSSFEKANHDLIYKKKFHVSPFMSMNGSYKFKSYLKNNLLNVNVEYFSKTESFIAYFTGVEKKLSDLILLKLFFKIPFMTLKIIVGIHAEAIILYFKGLKYFKCPKPNIINYKKYFKDK